ncbi:MAG: 3alpha(or 20beta)-hydroxysteroid dehydrogenase [Thermoleophilaceae bacterium]|nr:3alpha(or 20beta)-hydroxysteroid dehydrogenase [Thermoleophilaceae bacterium]
MVNRRLEGKHALITGAARGMGASHSRLLAEHGASVLITDVLDEEGEALAEGLAAQGLSVGYARLDVTRAQDWEAAVTTAEQRFGGLNVLVNNAGVSSYAGVAEEELDEWNRIMGVNATGVFLGMKFGIAAMRRAGSGSIINICSPAATNGDAREAAYGASKGAVRSLTISAALDYVSEGIRVNAVSPGLIMSEMALKRPQEEVQAWIDATPMGRAGTLLEISYAVLYLASDESSFVTGIDLPVDGGIKLGLQCPVRSTLGPPPAALGTGS